MMVISPDTTQDEVHRDTWYYKVCIHTDQSWLETDDGKQHSIFPGTITMEDIATGSHDPRLSAQAIQQGSGSAARTVGASLSSLMLVVCVSAYINEFSRIFMVRDF